MITVSTVSKLYRVFTSKDNNTRYWRENQARGKLQIAEETKQLANEYKK
jgi:hypothetical protein